MGLSGDVIDLEQASKHGKGMISQPAWLPYQHKPPLPWPGASVAAVSGPGSKPSYSPCQPELPGVVIAHQRDGVPLLELCPGLGTVDLVGVLRLAEKRLEVVQDIKPVATILFGWM